MSNESHERPLAARPAARPAPKLEVEDVIVVDQSAADINTGNPPFRFDIWSINVSFWNLFWIVVFIYMGLGVIEQQVPIGDVNVTYNTCSFGEVDGACSSTASSRVLYFGIAVLLIYAFVRGVQKRIKRGY